MIAEHCRKIKAYQDEKSCGPLGDDYNWEICGMKAGNCPDVIHTDLCETGEASRTQHMWNHWIGLRKNLPVREMCESAGVGFVFANGDESQAPGCGNCHCCKLLGIYRILNRYHK